MRRSLASKQVQTSDRKASARHRQSDEITISAIVPLYNEVENVDELVLQLIDMLQTLAVPFEIILIDDGSTDGTNSSIIEASHRFAEVRGVCLARNYGQSTAMQAGFDEARGEIIVTLDGDMQNDPADVPSMIQLLNEKQVDVVCGWRKHRRDPPVRKAFSRVANRLISITTGVKLHDYGCSLKVYRRQVLERTRLFGELHRFLPALLAEVGAEVYEVPVAHHPRKAGRSKYGLDRTLRVFLDLLLVLFYKRYLQRPIHVFGSIGLLCLIPGLSILFYLGSIRIFFDQDIGGRPLLLLGALLFISGLMLLGQGLLGELITRILHESGGRAHYHVKSNKNIATESPVGFRDYSPPNVVKIDRE